MATACTGQEPHDLGHENLAAAGGGAQAGRLDHRRAEAVPLFKGDVPRAGPDPHLQRHAAGPRSVVAVEGLLDRHRRSQRVGGAGEGGHHPVAEVLDQPAPVALDCIGDQPVVGTAERLGGVVAEARPKLS